MILPDRLGSEDDPVCARQMDQSLRSLVDQLLLRGEVAVGHTIEAFQQQPQISVLLGHLLLFSGHILLLASLPHRDLPHLRQPAQGQYRASRVPSNRGEELGQKLRESIGLGFAHEKPTFQAKLTGDKRSFLLP